MITVLNFQQHYNRLLSKSRQLLKRDSNISPEELVAEFYIHLADYGDIEEQRSGAILKRLFMELAGDNNVTVSLATEFKQKDIPSVFVCSRHGQLTSEEYYTYTSKTGRFFWVCRQCRRIRDRQSSKRPEVKERIKAKDTKAHLELAGYKVAAALRRMGIPEPTHQQITDHRKVMLARREDRNQKRKESPTRIKYQLDMKEKAIRDILKTAGIRHVTIAQIKACNVVLAHYFNKNQVYEKTG